jgi:hypothetical protein
MRPNYEFPADIETAQHRLGELTFEAQKVQDQLSNRNRTTFDGSRLSAQEYWTWRGKAVVALRHLHDERRELKLHLHKLRMDGRQEHGVSRFAVVEDLVRAYRDGDEEATKQLLDELSAMWVSRSGL